MSDGGVPRAGVRDGVPPEIAGPPALSITLLRTRRHVDLCRTATALCRG
ncbi:MAG TPA: putative leader peptide [Pseudonocardia sp.]